MRKLAIFAASFSAGIFLAQYLLPNDRLLPCAAAAFLLSCSRVVWKGKNGRRVFLTALGLSLAFGCNWLYVRQVQQPAQALADTEATVSMTLLDYATETNYGAKATVRIEGVPGKAVYYGDLSLLTARPGQIVTDTVYFQSASRIRDEEINTFTSRGVFLLAYQRGEAVLEEGSESALRWWPARLGHAMKHQIGVLFEGDTAGFLAAILTGDKTLLSAQGEADLEEAGLYHILAVSGMHCGYLLAFAAALIGRHRRRLVAAVTIPLLAGYAMLTGGSPSILRACVMLAFLLAAPLFRRSSDGPTSLSAALMLILLANPFAAASVSLQLSFSAMAGMLWLTPKLYRMLMGGKKYGKAFRFTVSSLSATAGALVFTTPLSAYYFGFMVLISPLSNLLCLGAAGLTFIFGLLSVLLSFVCQPLAMLMATLPRLGAQYILAAAHLLAKVPYHAVYTTNPYLKYWLGFVYLLFAAAYLCRPKARRKYALAALLGSLTLSATVYLGSICPADALEVRVLNVGQGQSVLVTCGETSALVDCGSASSWIDPAGIAADRLLTMGHGELDRLILTHYDSDHINGVEKLLARLPVTELLVPEPTDGTAEELLALAERHGAAVHLVDSVVTAGALTIYPPTGDGGDNERGLTVLACGGEETILITGDMNAAAEKALLSIHDLPDLDYLVAGHHGSKTSTSETLLDALTPETVCISVGSNSYGHPAEDTLRRLALHGCTVYRTDLHGTIRLTLH